jgi:amino acid transporter
MESKHHEKDVDTPSVNSLNTPAAPKYEFYDPSKESSWTRLGLSAESFKRAPGTTGCISSFSYTIWRNTKLYLLSSGQHVAGADNIEDLERIRAEAPMLQQKMKPRHLQMIAVGMLCGRLTISCAC